MLNMFDKLSDRNKGLVFLVVGTLLLLNALFNWFRPVIALCAAYLILLGLVKLEAHKQLMNLMNKSKK